MKMLLTALLTLVSSSAFAADPLIVKHNGTGFVMQSWVRYETCSVYADKVVITKKFGQGTNATELVEERKITLSNGIQNVIAEANKETLKKDPNLLCDGPSTTILTGKTVLFATGGCGAERQERTGGYSATLIEIVDRYCPVTHDFKN